MKRDFYTTIFSQTLSHDAEYLAAGDSFGNIGIFNVNKMFNHNDTADQDDAEDNDNGDESSDARCRNGRRKNFTNNASNDDGVIEPAIRFNCGSEAPVYSLHCDHSHLLALSDNTLCAYKWSDIQDAIGHALVPNDDSNDTPCRLPLAWSIDLTSTGSLPLSCKSDGDYADGVSYAAAAADSADGRLFAAVGRTVLVYDLETRRRLHTLTAHTGTVLNVRCARDSNIASPDECVSCCEDGSLRQWDCRQSSSLQLTSCLLPVDQYAEQLKPASSQRKSSDRWLSALDVSGQWIVCGGAVPAAVYHRRSAALSCVLGDSSSSSEDVAGNCTVARFVVGGNGSVAVGGDDAHVRLFNMASGASQAVIKTSCSAVFSLLVAELPSIAATGRDSPNGSDLNSRGASGLLTVAGCGQMIDVCAHNHYYRDFSIKFV